MTTNASDRMKLLCIVISASMFLLLVSNRTAIAETLIASPAGLKIYVQAEKSSWCADAAKLRLDIDDQSLLEPSSLANLDASMQRVAKLLADGCSKLDIIEVSGGKTGGETTYARTAVRSSAWVMTNASQNAAGGLSSPSLEGVINQQNARANTAANNIFRTIILPDGAMAIAQINSSNFHDEFYLANRRLMQLLSLSANPDLVNDNAFIERLAINFLTPEQDSKYRSSQYKNLDRSYWEWSGADEFEKKDSYRRFVAIEIPKILAKAPKLPIKIIELRNTRVSDYKEAESGFPIDVAHLDPFQSEYIERPKPVRFPEVWKLSPNAARSIRQTMRGFAGDPRSVADLVHKDLKNRATLATTYIIKSVRWDTERKRAIINGNYVSSDMHAGYPYDKLRKLKLGPILASFDLPDEIKSSIIDDKLVANQKPSNPSIDITKSISYANTLDFLASAQALLPGDTLEQILRSSDKIKRVNELDRDEAVETELSRYKKVGTKDGHWVLGWAVLGEYSRATASFPVLQSSASYLGAQNIQIDDSQLSWIVLPAYELKVISGDEQFARKIIQAVGTDERKFEVIYKLKPVSAANVPKWNTPKIEVKMEISELIVFKTDRATKQKTIFAHYKNRELWNKSKIQNASNDKVSVITPKVDIEAASAPATVQTEIFDVLGVKAGMGLRDAISTLSATFAGAKIEPQVNYSSSSLSPSVCEVNLYRFRQALAARKAELNLGDTTQLPSEQRKNAEVKIDEVERQTREQHASLLSECSGLGLENVYSVSVQQTESTQENIDLYRLSTSKEASVIAIGRKLGSSANQSSLREGMIKKYGNPAVNTGEILMWFANSDVKSKLKTDSAFKLACSGNRIWPYTSPSLVVTNFKMRCGVVIALKENSMYLLDTDALLATDDGHSDTRQSDVTPAKPAELKF